MEKLEVKPKDRDYIRTREGMFFCVAGYLHPPDRYTAYLKYSPAPAGKWQDAKTAYRRELPYYHVQNVETTLEHLKANYPHYVHYCPVRDIVFSMVPHQYVAHYYRPQERLQEILSSPQDPLEEEVVALVDYLQSVTGLPSQVLGLTGSILTGFHNPAFSDIDLLVFGRENTFHLREQMRQGQLPQFRLPGPERVEPWCQRVAQRFGLSQEDAAYLARRRWNYGFFGQRYVSIHATRTDDEITEVYGERIFRGQGAAEIEATVTNSSGSLFLPAVYRVNDVKVLSGDPAGCQVDEIVSYEGLYCDAADAGQSIRAHGKLETVNGELRRLVVGTTGVPGGGSIRLTR